MGLKHEYDTKKNMKKKAFKVSEKYLFWHEGFPKCFCRNNQYLFRVYKKCLIINCSRLIGFNRNKNLIGYSS